MSAPSSALTHQPAPSGRAGRAGGSSAAPVVIEVRDLEKTFRVPDRRVDSLKERVAHPWTKIEHRELHALKGVSFDVRQGEFFGIVGRNGSGKSSLLKILASIYRADAGSVRVAGRLAPFIELGVGFNVEVSARENIILNGVLMGLTRREAQRRLDHVIAFAELEDFVDLKLKNYSSGMMVRLAFSVMVEADADIMLIDEVLAVGDAAFAQKCMDVFHERRDAGRTIVLVTHDMATVQLLCHRAMLLHEGELRHIGEPEEVALRYYRLNFAQHGETAAEAVSEGDSSLDVHFRLTEATLRNRAGQPVENVEQGEPISVDVVVEAKRPLPDPVLTLLLLSEDGVVIASVSRELKQPVATGERIRLAGEIENPLVAGRYYLDLWVSEHQQPSLPAIQATRVLRFIVFGTAPRNGVVRLQSSVEPTLEPPTA
jgi:ABC-2 type transport system ATP-binding protein